MKINEIMTRDVKFLSSDMSVAEAIDLLTSQKISGLPVVDDKGQLVGMFTEKSVLKAVLPSYVSQVGHFVYENSPKTVKSKVAQLATARVVDLMRKEVVKVTEETPVSEVARIMLTQNVRRVPVVDKDGKMVGIAARSDVLEQLLKG